MSTLIHIKNGTLAKYTGWHDGRIGEPIPLMLCRVHAWLLAKIDVRIVTARVGFPVVEWPGYDKEIFAASAAEERRKIEDWCEKYLGQKLIITSSKDFKMVELWDDRCIRVEANTGRRLDDQEVL